MYIVLTCLLLHTAIRNAVSIMIVYFYTFFPTICIVINVNSFSFHALTLSYCDIACILNYFALFKVLLISCFFLNSTFTLFFYVFFLSWVCAP